MEEDCLVVEQWERIPWWHWRVWLRGQTWRYVRSDREPWETTVSYMTDVEMANHVLEERYGTPAVEVSEWYSGPNYIA